MSWLKPIKIAYRVFEAIKGATNDKPPVIFMHGLMESKDTWSRLPQRVANVTMRKVYAYDARNHGESEHTMSSNFKNNLYDLYNFMDALKIERAILVGHSMGGMTAIKAALDKPSRVEIPFIINMHTDAIRQEIINKWSQQLLGEAVEYCKQEDNGPNLAFVHVPPPYMELEKNKTLFNSVYLFRRLALVDALVEFEAEQLKNPLIGIAHGPSYFIFGRRNRLCGPRHYTMGHLKYFPSAEVISIEDYDYYFLDDEKLTDAICCRIP